MAEGGTAVIPCEVGNREGRVQWTKDGLTLGKKREKVFRVRGTVELGHADPTNNALFMNFRPSSDAELFVSKLRLSMQIGAERAKTCTQCVYIPTELPFCVPPLVVGKLEICNNLLSKLRFFFDVLIFTTRSGGLLY